MKKQCPNCKSNNVMGYALVTGYAYINLDDLSIDEPPDDCELSNGLTEFVCQDCDHEWEDEYEDELTNEDPNNKNKQLVEKLGEVLTGYVMNFKFKQRR